MTTATFERDTDEFIIDTPSALATKWWPGDMGTIANYAMVFAKLKLPDEAGEKYYDYGVAPFIVQIRDLDTHKHIPGVESGDMGPKLGMNSKDNGWLILHGLRVPRKNMLSRYKKVYRDGTVSV